MRIKKFGAYLIGLGLSSCSCPENNSINLIGTWTLDSISTPRHGYHESGNCRSLTFINKDDFTMESVCGDFHYKNKGKYFVLNNPKRGLKTITLIPDIQINGKDTIRTAYLNFDVVSITLNRL